MRAVLLDMAISLDGFVSGPSGGDDGLRLFAQLAPTQLERIRVLESPGVTHLRFRVVR